MNQKNALLHINNKLILLSPLALKLTVRLTRCYDHANYFAFVNKVASVRTQLFVFPVLHVVLCLKRSILGDIYVSI